MQKLCNLLGGGGGRSSKDYIGLQGGGERSRESKKGLRNLLMVPNGSELECSCNYIK